MNDNYFDEFFRKKLGNYSSPVPEDMWRRIRLKKDNDRRFIFLLSTLFLLLGALTTYFVMAVKPGRFTKPAAYAKNYTSNNGINNDSKNKNTETTNGSNETTGSARDKSIHMLSGSDRNAAEVRDPKSGMPGLSTQSLPFVSKGVPSNNDFDLRVNKPLSEAAVQKSEEKDARPQDAGITPKDNVEPIKADTANVTKDLAVHEDEPSSKNEKQSAKNNKKVQIQQGPLITGFFIEIYGSPDVPMNKISSRNANYLSHKDSTSKLQLSYSVGARLGIRLGEHWTGKLGFQYSDINEKFSYLNANALRTIPIVETRTIPDENGVVRTIVDTSSFIQAGKQFKRTYNHYKSVDLPVTIGYMIQGQKISTSLNAGVIFNVQTHYKGDILDPTLTPTEINSSHIYRDKTGVSLYFGIGLIADLNEKISLFTEPYLRYRVTDMTSGYQPFAQKINVGGLSLGIRYNFKK